jgi:hypothetical protein
LRRGPRRAKLRPMNENLPPAAPSLESGAVLPHAMRLDRLAELAVRVGLNLAPGQELLMTAPIESLALTRRITEHDLLRR